MRRALLVSSLLCGCVGPVVEGLEVASDAGSVQDEDPSYYVAGSGCGAGNPGDPGDPVNLVHPGVGYQRPPCDLAVLNQPSTSPPVALQGIDTPTVELDGVAQLMVGQWHGTQTSPWDGTHEVSLTLFENGRYSGTVKDYGVSLFYYGESCAYHRQFWSVQYGSAALAFGQVQLSDEFGFSCNLEEMRRIQVDAKTLRFELWWREVYGPVTLDLQRVELAP